MVLRSNKFSTNFERQIQPLQRENPLICKMLSLSEQRVLCRTISRYILRFILETEREIEFIFRGCFANVTRLVQRFTKFKVKSTESFSVFTPAIWRSIKLNICAKDAYLNPAYMNDILPCGIFHSTYCRL